MKAIKYAALAVGVVALIATGVGAVALGGLAGTLTVAGISTSTLFLVAGGLSVAASLLQKGPKVPASQTDRLSANIDPRAFRKSWLGQTAAPVDVRYEEWSGKDQEYCDWIVALSSHAADGVEEIWLNAEMAWSMSTGPSGKYAGYFTVPNIVLEGSPANAFTFASGKWNAASARLTGCAYLRMRFKVTGNSKKAESPFASGIPSRITIIGRGAKLYDPRRDSTVPGGSGPMRWNDQSTWRYTTDDGVVIGENLPLQILFRVLGWKIRNPLTGELKLAVGSGVPARRIALDSFQVAANLADELVNRAAGGNEPRYHGAGVVSEGDDPKTTLDALCAACCGRFRDTSGKLSLVILHNDLASAATDDGLSDDDVVGPFTWDPDPSLEATPNIARGKYVDASTASLYQLIDYPEVALPSPDGQDRIFPLDLGFVESPSHAQRVAKQVLQRKQYLREFTAPFDIRAWKYGVGDIVPFTFAPLGFVRVLFRVKQQEQAQGSTCNMTLSFESAAFYAWDADDSLPVMAADPIVYDSRNNPLILAIEDAGKSAEWDGITGDGKPADNATNSADPTSPFGRDDSVAAILARLAEARRNATEGLEQIAAANAALTATKAEIAETVDQINDELETAREGLASTLTLANSTAAIARQTVQAALSGQLLEQRRKARVDALTHMDGVAVGVVVRQEIAQRIEGEVATASFLLLLGVKNSTGTGIILDTSTVFVSPDQSLGEKFSSIDAEFTRSDTVTTASIARLDTALATEVEARTSSITSLDTKFTNALGNAIGAVTADYREAVSGEAGARATAITTLQADFTTKIGAATTSITDLARTTSDADQALGERITQVSAAFQTALGTTNATIVTVQQAQANEVDARTTAITNLGATFTTALGNAITAVTNDYREAVSGEAGARATAITGLQADFTTKIGVANTSITDLARTTSDADRALGERITQVDASFQTALTASNTTIATLQQAQADEVAARATAITSLGTSFDTKLGNAVNAMTMDYRQADSNEAGARATAITDLGATFTNALGNAINATTSRFDQAMADEAGARATQYGLVTARLDNVGNRGASVEQLFSAQADALGNLSARAGLAVTAGNVVSGIYVTAADGSNGKVSDITLEAMTINVGTAKLIFNNGSIMEVMGTGFGVGNEFISWYGPSMPIGQCSRANGTIWKTVTGDGYYGGALSAGVLTNGGQSSSVGPDVISDTGGFGSDGGKITVVMSWSYTWTWTVRYPGTTAGRQAFDNAAANYGATSGDGYGYFGTRVETGSPRLTLAREIGGASRTDVATATISQGSGSFQGQRPLPAGSEEGYADFSASWSTSLTYTDPDRIITDRRFIATLARGFTPSSGAVSQRVTIITTEE